MRWWLAVMATSQKRKDKLFLSEIMIYYIYFYKGGRGQDISFCTAEGLFKIFAYKSEFLATFLYMSVVLMLWLNFERKKVMSELTLSVKGRFLSMYLVN